MMRTAVLQAPRRFEVTEQPTPRPGRGEAVVRVAGTAVFHTDLAIYTGRHPGVRYPVILGHEAAGVVEAVGPDTSMGVGARVVINQSIACGGCECWGRGAGGRGVCQPGLAAPGGAGAPAAVSRRAWKRDLARRMRAAATVDPSVHDVVAEVLAVTAGRGADVVIDTTGDPSLVRPA